MSISDIIKIIIESILSISSIIISIAVFNYSRKTNKTTFEMGIFQLIQNSKINLDNQIRSIMNEIKSLEPEKISDYISNSILAPVETYLNALDDACALFFSKEINQKRFLKLYKEDILTIFESKVYDKVINKKDSTFISLKKMHLYIIEKEI